jgi:uncharacterized protein YmfQ (DUF2313 family)
MPAPAYSAADYLAALQSLLPRGKVWPTDPDAVQVQALTGYAQEPARLNARANYLLVDSFPATAVELLTDWEQSLGLPDPCAGEAPTIQQRQGEVVARFTNGGGQSAPYFIAYAAFLGYTITITNFSVFRAGHNRAGHAVCGADWNHTWAINAPLNSIIYFRAGRSAAGEPLRAWGNEVLECELNRIKPAHTILQFRYS